MGGTGPGHKSWKARLSRLRNIQKARAARRRAPLPWRSEMESRIIEQLVWQWFLEVRGWRLEVGNSKDLRAEVSKQSFDATDPPGSPSRGPGRPRFARANGMEREREQVAPPIPQARLAIDLEGPICAKAAAGKPWAKYRVARFLGVSHTWVNKLVKRFEADPERMRRRMAAFAPASFEKLERAREETRRQRERGWLRGPIRVRRVKVTLWGKKRTVAVATRAEKRRAGLLRQSLGGPAFAKAAARQAGAPYARHQELPQWARGLLLPGEVGMAPRRAVPFAFRRRR